MLRMRSQGSRQHGVPGLAGTLQGPEWAQALGASPQRGGPSDPQRARTATPATVT